MEYGSLTYAQVEGTLARLHGAKGEPQRKAFRGRLKHLKRLGIPRGSSPGRGKKILYTNEQVYEWALCLELAEFGLDPTLIVKILDNHWNEIFHYFGAIEAREFSHELFLVVQPSFMESAWSATPPCELQWIQRSSVHDDRKLESLRGARRSIVINVTHLLRAIAVQSVNTDTQLSYMPKEE